MKRRRRSDVEIESEARSGEKRKQNRGGAENGIACAANWPLSERMARHSDGKSLECDEKDSLPGAESRVIGDEP